jgi:hypothetical protein
VQLCVPTCSLLQNHFLPEHFSEIYVCSTIVAKSIAIYRDSYAAQLTQHARMTQYTACSESLHFVGLVISACLFTWAPRLSCTADSSAALRATAPVRSLFHAWPCSAPLQRLPPLPFPAPSLLVIFCAHLTFHHSLFLPHLPLPPRFPLLCALIARAGNALQLQLAVTHDKAVHS